VREGDWFWEFQIERAGGQGGRNEGRGDGQGSWVRVGVGRRESGLNAPVGVDGYSYGIRDKTGDKVHQSHTTSYGKPFKSGTTVGVYLSLPPRTATDDTTTTTTDNNPSSSSARDPRRIMRKRVPILYKNQLYFEQLEYTSSKEMDELLVDPILKQKQLKAQEEEAKKKKNKKNPGTRIHDGDSNSGSNKNQNLPPMRELPIIPRSKLGFWIDGEFQGKAFENLFDFIPLMKHAKKEHQKKEKTNRLVTENHHDDGTTGYYPFVSVFGGGTVTLNSGEQGFKFPPSRQDIASLLDDEVQQDREEEGRTSVRWKPLCERYQEFYTEQTRLDDLDELEQIKLLVDVRAKELARLQRQAEKAERAAVAAAAGAGEGGGGGGVSKKAKTSSSSISYSNEIGVGMGMGNAIALTQYQNQIVGTAKGQEESPVNSPKPVVSFSEDAIKSEGM
jgi:COMPASS component BRE2